MTNLPEAFLRRMEKRLGSDFPAFLASYETPPRKGVRINTLKISAAEFSSRAPFPLGGQVCGDASCRLAEGDKLGADPYHFAGLYYLQEPSAMTVGEAALTAKKERVLDLCAAPGGKTTQIAAQMKGEGILIANEIEAERAKILSQNVERMGIANCAVTNATPEKLAEKFPAYFDLILADVPCSGEGMFKKEPNAVAEWSEENVARCAARQKTILEEAAKMLADDGRLVYSTCTFAEEEDEWQIEDFLSRHPEFSLAGEKKFYPHKFCGEGHFRAVLEKSSLASSAERGQRGKSRGVKPYSVRANPSADKAFRAFAEDLFGAPPQGEIATLTDGRMYLVPAGTPDLAGLRLLRLGVELGKYDGKLFKPAHALAMALGERARRKVSLSRTESARYLHGETVGADLANGWCVVCVEEFPLGFGKCVNGVVKNHLPKGLRMIK